MDINSKDIEEDSEDDSYCPALPPHLIKSSKTLPTDNEISNTETEDEDLYCPPLPPHLAIEKCTKGSSDFPSARPKIKGPSLPPNYVPPAISQIEFSEESSSDEDVIGPMPSSDPDPDYRIREIELRASRMWESLTKKDDKPLVRESWMLELPDDKPKLLSLGLGPRKFARTTPREKGDRSMWTDLPADKERKAKEDKKEDKREEESVDVAASNKRDEEIASIVDEYNLHKRSESLVDMHKSKKVKKDENASYVRRPFSREDDMSVNKFDEAQKATIMKKASQLNDRFSGGQRKFL